MIWKPSEETKIALKENKKAKGSNFRTFVRTIFEIKTKYPGYYKIAKEEWIGSSMIL